METSLGGEIREQTSTQTHTQTDALEQLTINGEVSRVARFTSLSLFKVRSTRATCWSTCLRDKDMVASGGKQGAGSDG